MYIGGHAKYPLFLSHLNQTSISSTDFRKILRCQISLKFVHSGSGVIPFGRTDALTNITKLIVAFCNFANAPKREYTEKLRMVLKSKLNARNKFTAVISNLS
jgi:hypothetical protein